MTAFGDDMKARLSTDGPGGQSADEAGPWDDHYERLRAKRTLYHNDDYLEFLVRRVWRLDRPCRVVDFGCGYGRMGMVLMSLLPEGSAYTGIDTSGPLLARGRELSADLAYPAEFIEADVREAPFPDNSFDIAFSHAVLMHVPDAEKAIAEMVRVTADGGMVITCDANRNAANALLQIHETNELDNAPLELFQTMNAHVRQQKGVDYNMGIRMPILLHRAGLQNVGCRISDAVRLLFPPFNAEQEKLFKAMCDEGFGYQPTDEEAIAGWREQLVSRGISPEAAAKEVRRELDRDFLHKGRDYHTVWTGALTFTYGTVAKSKAPSL